MATLPELLKTLVDNSGSDLHLTTNTPPQIRVHGKLQTLDLPPLGPAETKALAYSVLTDAQKKRFEEIARARLLVRHPRHRALPLQRLQPARRGRRRLPGHPRADQERSASSGCRRCIGNAGRAAARPGAGHRPDRQRQVDDAGGDDRQDQHRAARAHPHHRGSDRVHPPAQGLPRQPARGAQRHARLRRRAARRAARGSRTSSSSASCATSRRSSRRCASPRPAT